MKLCFFYATFFLKPDIILDVKECVCFNNNVVKKWRYVF